VQNRAKRAYILASRAEAIHRGCKVKNAAEKKETRVPNILDPSKNKDIPVRKIEIADTNLKEASFSKTGKVKAVKIKNRGGDCSFSIT